MSFKKLRAKKKQKRKTYVCTDCMTYFVAPRGVEWIDEFSFECPYCGGVVQEDDVK